MKSIHIKKGYDLPISGVPSSNLFILKPPDKVAALPERIPYIRPRLVIREGDAVKIGSVLFEDKRHPAMKFLSPGGGTIQQINFGPRRIVREIVIHLGPDEAEESFERFSDIDIENSTRSHLVQTILKGGLWGLFRELPFGNIPNPETAPPSIIVAVDSKEPFHPLPGIYLADRAELFQFGVKILKKISENVYLTTTSGENTIRTMLNGAVAYTVKGPYPAGMPGVSLYHTKKGPHENRAWHITGQDLLLLGSLFKNGRYPTERMVVLSGSMANDPKHVLTRLGVPLSHLAGHGDDKNSDARFIVGGVFTGYTSPKNSYLGLYETTLMILPEGDEDELFGFARPGFDKPSRSKLFLSYFRNPSFNMDCGLHGEERACINCGYCAEVCAVDILPQFALKCTLAEEMEEALAHGLLDCVSCGLCTYVCPSKIEICESLREAKEAYYKETT